MKIDVATLKDTQTILYLEDKFFKTDKITKKTFKFFLRQQSICFLMSLEGKPIGYAIVVFHKKIAWLCSICAEKGYGKYPLKEVEKETIKRGYTSIKLEVRTDNNSAKDFYERNNYKCNGSLINYYEDGCNAYKYKKYLYRIAMLFTPEEKYPPSDKKALNKFIKEGSRLGVNLELVNRNVDLTKYNALFIRDMTHPENYCYELSNKAETLGLIVIDDPKSIELCTNKVIMDTLFRDNNIPTLKSWVVKLDSDLINFNEFPLVVKIPDGSFSSGVHKVSNKEELIDLLNKLFYIYDELLIQEYAYTEFDWRIGILDNDILFICKYYMVKDFWKILDHHSTGYIDGDSKTLTIEESPKELLELAIKCSKMIGTGLYGIDIKEKNNNFYVIEINDNPNIDYGIEDEKSNIYEKIILHFKNQISQIYLK